MNKDVFFYNNDAIQKKIELFNEQHKNQYMLFSELRFEKNHNSFFVVPCEFTLLAMQLIGHKKDHIFFAHHPVFVTEKKGLEILNDFIKEGMARLNHYIKNQTIDTP